jgi:fluoride exporter
VTPGLFVAVALAGAVGAVARARVGGAVQRRFARRGLGTAFVNLAGAFALGLWSALAPGPVALEVVGTGFLGAFTTFSTWMAEAALTWREGRRWAAAVEVVATLAGGVALAALCAAVGAALA